MKNVLAFVACSWIAGSRLPRSVRFLASAYSDALLVSMVWHNSGAGRSANA